MHPPPQQFTPVYAAPVHHQHHHTSVNPLQYSISLKPFISLSMTQQSQAKIPQLDSGLAVPTFQNQATIQDGRVIVQQVQGRQTQSFAATGNRGIATTSKGNYAAGQAKDVQEMLYSEQTHIVDFIDNEITSDSNIIPYSQYLQESQDAVIQDTTSSAPNDLLVLSLVEQMTNHVANLDKENQTNKMEINTLKQNLSNHVKENESLSTTLTVFKTKFKEKESKYMDKEIVLENQNKELENIIFRIEAPSELPKVSLVNESLKKLKYHLASFDKVVKKRTTSDDISTDTFNAFDKTLLDEITEVQTVFNQMEALVKNVKKDIDEIETINIELEHSVAKLLSENENFKKEREHLKSIYKDQFDSIKKTCVQSNEHCASLIAQINEKSIENSDLNAQLQEKVFAIAALKNKLRKLKGQNIVDTAVSKPSATIAPGMFKLDIESISPRLKNNRDAHEVYLEKTIENIDTLRGLVECARNRILVNILLIQINRF
ncbi:hypothetical protein Tco_0754384 [Tanacetum coccineum]